MSNVNAYAAGNRVTGENIDQNTWQRTAKGSDLGMQDFLNLMAAQMANQDPMNPQGDTEFIAQMAQFSSLESMKTLTELTYAQYGAGMAGKVAIVASYDEAGNYAQVTGVISSVQFMNGECTVTVNGKAYGIGAIMEILNEMPKPPVEDPPKEDPPKTDPPAEEPPKEDPPKTEE